MHLRKRYVFPFASLLLASQISVYAAEANYDLVIRNGHVIDGTGSPWYAADVAVKDGRIAAMRPSFTATSAEYHGDPVPSMTWPLRMTRS